MISLTPLDLIGTSLFDAVLTTCSFETLAGLIAHVWAFNFGMNYFESF